MEDGKDFTGFNNKLVEKGFEYICKVCHFNPNAMQMAEKAGGVGAELQQQMLFNEQAERPVSRSIISEEEADRLYLERKARERKQKEDIEMEAITRARKAAEEQITAVEKRKVTIVSKKKALTERIRQASSMEELASIKIQEAKARLERRATRERRAQASRKRAAKQYKTEKEFLSRLHKEVEKESVKTEKLELGF